MCAELWGWTILETLVQPTEMIFDMFRDINLKDAIERAKDKGNAQTVEDAWDYLEAYTDENPYEEFESEMTPIRFG